MFYEIQTHIEKSNRPNIRCHRRFVFAVYDKEKREKKKIYNLFHSMLTAHCSSLCIIAFKPEMLEFEREYKYIHKHTFTHTPEQQFDNPIHGVDDLKTELPLNKQLLVPQKKYM